MTNDCRGRYATDDVVELCDFIEADVADVATACNDAEITRWTATIPFPYTQAHARWWIEQHRAWRQAHRAYVFAIVARGERRIAGSIALESVDAPPVQIGYWVAPWSRNRGFASHALRLLCDWAFENLPADHLELVTKLGNERSERVALNAGFELVGTKIGHRPVGGRDDSAHDVKRWSIARPLGS